MRVVEYTDAELTNVATGSVFVYDIEVYPNFFCICFRNIVNDKHVIFTFSPDTALNVDKLRWLIWKFCLVGFNSNNYDLVLLTLALWGSSIEQLKEASDQIVYQNLRPRDMEKEHGMQLPILNHIDLIEVAPLDASLKLYGGRLHSKTMRDLPYSPETILTREQAADVTEYCCNDLEHTKLLLIELFPHIELRQDLGKQYGRDMRSLSDAQVAEAIICGELQKHSGWYPRRPKEVPPTCTYAVPSYMQFQTKELQAALAVIQHATFAVEDNGVITMPETVKKLSLKIGKTVYKMGIGGLHSQETEICHKADAETDLIDVDVASYYPMIVLNQKLFPPHLGELFLTVYRTIVERRLTAKKAGNKKISEGLKIAINGIFGKFGNKYSAVYAPSLMLQVTLTGQLSILLLIEAIELAGVPVVSGNTDGIVIRCPRARYNDLRGIVNAWEAATGFSTEETRYKALYSRDVNNYIAVKEDGKCKTKGVYSEVGSAQNSVLSKNPETLICSDAVQALITKGTPIEETIKACQDVRRFVAVRTVKGGAVKNGGYLGKAIRWYYAKGESGVIEYKTSGNKVPKTEGARPLMVLPDNLPADLDYAYYIAIAREMLFDVGYYVRPHTPQFF